VIDETAELPTKLARIVVTDDQGRYHPRSAGRELQCLGARLWLDGFGQAHREAGPAS
jgi:hypothetical protein